MGKEDSGVVRTRLDYEHRLLNSKLSNGKTLLELTEFRGITLWWFVDPGFNEILKTYFWGKESTQEKRRGRLKIKKGLRSLAWVSVLGNDLILRILARSLSRPSRSLIGKDAKTKRRILITGEDIEWRRTGDSASGKEMITDQFFKPILDIAKNRPDHFFISSFPLKSPLIWALPSFFRSIEIAKEKNDKWSIPHIPFDTYSSINSTILRIQAWSHFSRIWKQLESDPIFKELIKSEKVGNISELLGHFRRYFHFDLPEAAYRIDLAHYCLKGITPDLVILEEEYGRFERALIIAARNARIPTLGIQHGVIHEDHKGYIYRKGEISKDGLVGAPFSPVPDITAVYGERHRRLLLEDSDYPNRAVKVTGQPRYDRIAEIMKVVDPGEVHKKIPLPHGKRMVLMAMAFNGLPDEENRFYLETILHAINGISNAFLVIKQHPGETESHRRMILEMLVENRENAVLVPKTSDTLSLIWASDLVLTRYSTVGLEAVALKKPLIILNLSGQPDPIDYVSRGVAIGVYNASDLQLAIVKSLSFNDHNMAANRDEYILDNLYKMDGGSSQRVYNLIDKLLEISN